MKHTILALGLLTLVFFVGCGDSSTSGTGGNGDCTITKGGTEICDGIDNDCNGEVDDTFADLGEACTVGQGACASAGVRVCAANEVATECDATAGAPSAEICDGLDNDCDTEIDESYPTLGDACSVGEGECRREGTVICAPDGDTECGASSNDPMPESICDNLDNDCDGEVDEGCDDDQDGFCDSDFTLAGTADICPKGGRDCNDNAVAINPDAIEVCDGVDNNCNNVNDLDATDLTSFYLDCDGDGYASDIVADTRCEAPSDALTRCNNRAEAQYVTRAPTAGSIDCNDTEKNAYPGQFRYFDYAMTTAPPGGPFDFNCDGVETKKETGTGFNGMEACQADYPLPTNSSCIPNTSNTSGWYTSLPVPECGPTNFYFVYCSSQYNYPSCTTTRKIDTDGTSQYCH